MLNPEVIGWALWRGTVDGCRTTEGANWRGVCRMDLSIGAWISDCEARDGRFESLADYDIGGQSGKCPERG